MGCKIKLSPKERATAFECSVSEEPQIGPEPRIFVSMSAEVQKAIARVGGEAKRVEVMRRLLAHAFYVQCGNVFKAKAMTAKCKYDTQLGGAFCPGFVYQGGSLTGDMFVEVSLA